MNYSKTIENIKLTQLTAKESSEFVKRYEKPLLIPSSSTESIVQEPLQLKEDEAKDEAKDENDDSDESSIDPVSLQATAAAEEAYQKYLAAEAIDDEEFGNPPISVDTSDAAPPELEDVITIPVSPTSNNAETQDKIQEKVEPKLEEVTDSLLQQNLEPEKSSEEDDSSIKRKTIKFEGQ
jgi:hypothetical protein